MHPVDDEKRDTPLDTNWLERIVKPDDGSRRLPLVLRARKVHASLFH
jgi:hypothetical protein